jgi:A/G-specific adenine glycosylase
LAFAAQNPESYPVRRLKKNIPLRYAVAAVILDDGGHILMARRAQRGLLGGLWKFPGGFCKTGEDPHEALERTVQEEVGFVLREKSLQGVVRHAYTHFRLRLLVFTCSTAHAPQNLGTALDCQWISPSGIHKLPLSKADRLAAVVGGVL